VRWRRASCSNAVVAARARAPAGSEPATPGRTTDGVSQRSVRGTRQCLVADDLAHCSCRRWNATPRIARSAPFQVGGVTTCRSTYGAYWSAPRLRVLRPGVSWMDRSAGMRPWRRETVRRRHNGVLARSLGVYMAASADFISCTADWPDHVGEGDSHRRTMLAVPFARGNGSPRLSTIRSATVPQQSATSPAPTRSRIRRHRAARRCRWRDTLVEPVRHLDEHLVSGGVTERVVDLLESSRSM